MALLVVAGMLFAHAAWIRADAALADSAPRRQHGPVIIAHRGDTDHAPENSLQSIRAAGRAHADYAEIDVRLTADGRPVVFHDRATGRLSCDGVNRRINRLTFRRLSSMPMDTRRMPNDDFHVPSLVQAIRTAERSNDHLGLLLDMKTDDRHAARLVRIVDGTVRRTGFARRAMFMSTSRRAVDLILARHPRWKVGWCLSGRAEQVDWRQRMDFVVIRSREVTRRFMRGARAHGVAVYVGKADDRYDVCRALRLGARGLLSDSMHDAVPSVRAYLDHDSTHVEQAPRAVTRRPDSEDSKPRANRFTPRTKRSTPSMPRSVQSPRDGAQNRQDRQAA